MKRAARNRVPRNRPLLDPARAPYVRAALARKQRAAEKAACSGKDATKHEATCARLRTCVAMLEDEAS